MSTQKELDGGGPGAAPPEPLNDLADELLKDVREMGHLKADFHKRAWAILETLAAMKYSELMGLARPALLAPEPPERVLRPFKYRIASLRAALLQAADYVERAGGIENESAARDFRALADSAGLETYSGNEQG